MKKLLSVLMTIAMLAAMPFAAMAEEPFALLEGLVTELVDGGFVMQDIQQGEVMINTSEATVWDGDLMEGELAVGQYVYVEYDGRMTFSLPPQVHADRVACNVLTGSVAEVLEDGSILMNDDTFGEVIVHLGDDMRHVYAGMPITVYFNGVMALSLPGQVTASHIVLPLISGCVSNLTGEGFTLTDADGVEYEVKLAEDTLISEEIIVVEDAPEAEAEEEAEETQAEETAEEIIEENAGETDEETAGETGEDAVVLEDAELAEETAVPAAELLSESAIEWADGDIVTVYYNGIMSRSLPAQITAMEIVVIR
ncbi:MAG: hypothetical protein PUE14_07365 [Clostridia bacterium]|nr:hypothetical protein [Clostridia bacterium]